VLLIGDTTRAMRVFLRRCPDTPIFRAVVFIPWFQSDNGDPGGAALGLAGFQ